jgi:hypothetical protein
MRVSAPGAGDAGDRPAGAFVPWTILSAGSAGDALLDPPIRPLVAALNATGWAHTVFSCAGHPDEPDSVQRGRRQAHVDALVSDLRRWRSCVRRCRPAAIDAVRALRLPRVRLRVAEGPLGRLPGWLRDQTRDLPSPSPPAPWRRLLDGADETGWYYRRLVFEPVPYSLDAAACRHVLDAALAAAVASLGPQLGVE